MIKSGTQGKHQGEHRNAKMELRLYVFNLKLSLCACQIIQCQLFKISRISGFQVVFIYGTMQNTERDFGSLCLGNFRASQTQTKFYLFSGKLKLTHQNGEMNTF